jgi:DNA-binding transcriptional ArsR family regulator
MNYTPKWVYSFPVARQRSSDLFPTDSPIPASQMIGRADDVREITTSLSGGSSVVLAGARRTGKTSVCDAVLGKLQAEGLYTIAVDLFRIATVAELAEALVAGTLSNRSGLRRILHQTRRAGRFVADTLQSTAVLKSKTQLGEELEIAFAPGLAARDPERYLDYALELPARIAAADSKSVVLFFDEFQEVAGPHHPYGDPDRLTKRMRAIFQRSTDVSYLFAGSLEHLMRDLFTPSHRALHQFGGFHDLRPIDPDAWISGLTERFRADDCRLRPDVVNRILDYGERHPRTTMLIAQKTHLATIELDTHEVDLSTVEQGLLTALSADRVSHEQTVERIRRLHKLGLTIAQRVARGESPYPGLSRGAVSRALEALREAAIIESRGRGDWQFSNPLLRRFLANMIPFDQT